MRYVDEPEFGSTNYGNRQIALHSPEQKANAILGTAVANKKRAKAAQPVFDADRAVTGFRKILADVYGE